MSATTPKGGRQPGPDARPATPGRKPRFTPDQIVEAALALADEVGIADMTMQRLGERLGVKAMALYRYFDSKDALVDALVDAVYAEVELPPAGTDWAEAMRLRARSTREALVRHPWAVELMESRQRPGPANLQHHDAVLGYLIDAGWSVASAPTAYNVINSYVYGFALQERSLPVATPEAMKQVGAEMLAAMPAGAFPHLAAVAMDRIASGFDYATEFDFGLDLIIAALRENKA